MSAVWNPQIDQGSAWRETLSWKNDLGVPNNIISPARMDIRTNSGTVIKQLGTPDTNFSGLTLGADGTGLIYFFISANDTVTMTPGWHKFDLFVYNSDNERVKLVFGTIEIIAKVTDPL